MSLDLNITQRDAVGLTYVLERLSCATPYGRELAKQLTPYSANDLTALLRVHDNMDVVLGLHASHPAAIEDLRDVMAHFGNVTAMLMSCQKAPLGEVEMFEIKGFLLTFERFLPMFATLNAKFAGICFVSTTVALDVLDPKRTRVAPFYIEDDASPALADARRAKRRLSANDSERANVAAIEDAEEQRVLADLSRRLGAFIPAILDNITNLGAFDLIVAKALLAQELGGVRPTICGGRYALTNMFNPMVAAALDGNFTKTSMMLDSGTTIITGANMGGKSVAIRTAALNAALCRFGFYVFADVAEIPLFDGVSLISEDLQDARGGLSSFGAEIAKIKDITAASRNGFLFIALDEPARATNPAEGAAITRALAAFFAQTTCICLISTHYDGIVQDGMRHYQVAGLRADVVDADFVGLGDWMDYSLIEMDSTTPPPRDALRICEIMGLDAALIESIKADLCWGLSPSCRITKGNL